MSNLPATVQSGGFLDSLSNVYVLAPAVVIIALMVLGLILARLYRRASKEIAFVRTGFGGEKVVMNGGALVLPVFHETMPVNMTRCDSRSNARMPTP